jgi:hypothetical protein
MLAEKSRQELATLLLGTDGAPELLPLPPAGGPPQLCHPATATSQVFIIVLFIYLFILWFRFISQEPVNRRGCVIRATSYPEAELLDVIWTKILRVILLAIHSRLY